jgi:hypothetical protein
MGRGSNPIFADKAFNDHREFFHAFYQIAAFDLICVHPRPIAFVLPRQ